ncbi:MAG: lipoyl(octanoyl) transferase LipB [Alphaproteobacteria bacterium]|nr:lipoyl(octanoyl) transferase LipB [Alphaproteobacteria bacterium]
MNLSAAPEKSCSPDRWSETARPDWRVSAEPVAYDVAVAAMEARVAAIHAGTAPEEIWLLEHPSLYTAGTSAKAQDLLTPARFPVHKTGRGGQYTYHGPGQRIAYAMLNLKERGADVRCYVRDLEEWVIRALAQFNVVGERREGRVGIWVDRGKGREDKIAAIGVRVRHWVTFHGISINVEPDLSHFDGIVPCGIAEQNLGVTSLVDLGLPVGLHELDIALETAFAEVFGPIGTRL